MSDFIYGDRSFHNVTGPVDTSNVGDEYSHDDRENFGNHQRKREIYHHRTDWLITSIAWSNDLLPSQALSLAVCSSIEDYSNQIQIVSLSRDSLVGELRDECTFEHPYPATKAIFSPTNLTQQLNTPQSASFNQLLATTADYLRIWRVNRQFHDTMPTHDDIEASTNSGAAANNNGNNPSSTTDVKLENVLINNKNSKYCAPLTSFDWNEVDPSMIITCSVDTLCTLWDIEYGKPVNETKASSVENNTVSSQTVPPTSNDATSATKSASATLSSKVVGNVETQVVAHDREVYDVSFSGAGSGKDVFVSSGADGTVRMFDLRHLKRSTVLYEVPQVANQNVRETSIARVSCNKQNAYYVSAFAFHSNELKIIDIRNPGRPAANLSISDENITCMSWAPHSAYHISTGTSMRQALIWDLLKLPSQIENPMLAYNAAGQINAINWCPTHEDWIAIAFRNCLELLRV